MEKKSSETKMVIVMRKDLKMTKGKYVAQGSHASLGNVLRIQQGNNEKHKEVLNKWLSDAFVKVCLYVNSYEELMEIYEKSMDAGHATTIIVDNGLTMFNGELTTTCLSILGYRDEVDEITGHLSLL